MSSTPMTRSLRDWIDDRAHVLDGTDPDLPLDDLEPFRPVVSGAGVVALGEATRFAHEVFGTRVRLTRFLIERLGFRTLAIEESPDVGDRMDRWVRGLEPGEPGEVLDEAWQVWRTVEFAGMLHRLREYNRRRPGDPVRFVGFDRFRTGSPASYDPAVSAGLIADRHDAEGAPIVYWGGTGHTAVHRPAPGFPPHPFARTEGTHLRDRLGAGYVSVAVTFDHGSARWDVAPASPLLAESALAESAPAGSAATRLWDLTGAVPPEAAAWLDTPTRARVFGPDYDATRDADFSIAGTPLRTMFDAVVHVPEVSSVVPLG